MDRIETLRELAKAAHPSAVDQLIELVREYGACCRREGRLGHPTRAAADALAAVRRALSDALEK